MRLLILILFSTGSVFTVTSGDGEKENSTTILPVQGMHCTSCGSMVRRTVLRIEGIETVQIDIQADAVKIEHTGDESVEDAIQAIRRMGYTVAHPDSIDALNNK